MIVLGVGLGSRGGGGRELVTAGADVFNRQSHCRRQEPGYARSQSLKNLSPWLKGWTWSHVEIKFKFSESSNNYKNNSKSYLHTIHYMPDTVLLSHDIPSANLGGRLLLLAPFYSRGS